MEVAATGCCGLHRDPSAGRDKTQHGAVKSTALFRGSCRTSYKYITQVHHTSISYRCIIQAHHTGTSYRYIIQVYFKYHTCTSYRYIKQIHQTGTPYRKIIRVHNTRTSYRETMQVHHTGTSYIQVHHTSTSNRYIIQVQYIMQVHHTSTPYQAHDRGKSHKYIIQVHRSWCSDSWHTVPNSSFEVNAYTQQTVSADHHSRHHKGIITISTVSKPNAYN